jgi:peptide subunit release factor 1 (eRF1)
VTTITEETVRALAGFRGVDAPVTTCYLDVDGRHLPTHREVQQSFGTLVRHAGLNGHTHPSVTQDLQRMERHVRGLKRARARGLAMFSCTAHGFWEVHELRMPVTSRLLVHDTPCVRQLEDVIEHSARLGVLLTDRQRARLFVYELGEAVEHSEAVDPLVRDGTDGRGDLVKTRVGNQRQEQALQHVRRAAQHAFAVYQDVGFEHLLIGAPTPDVLAELEQALHPYLRDRIAGRLSVPIGVGRERLDRLVHDAATAMERRAEAALVYQLQAAAGTTGGVTGLAGTLAAIGDRRVERLFVSRGYMAEGWRCHRCGRLATVGRRCPACADAMDHVDDVVEDAVQAALVQHGRVSILVDNADLDVLGCIGALLRY